MMKARLNYEQLENYLNQLTSKNFIKKEDKTYKTTKKGLAVIEACNICLSITE